MHNFVQLSALMKSPTKANISQFFAQVIAIVLSKESTPLTCFPIMTQRYLPVFFIETISCLGMQLAGGKLVVFRMN